jgi:hypothetical protein
VASTFEGLEPLEHISPPNHARNADEEEETKHIS